MKTKIEKDLIVENLHDIDLADPNFFKPQHVDILIGTEIFVMSLGSGLPTLVNSVFGWVVGGSFAQGIKTKSYTCNVALKPSNRGVEDLLTNFWQIEEFHVKMSLLRIQQLILIIESWYAYHLSLNLVC